MIADFRLGCLLLIGLFLSPAPLLAATNEAPGGVAAQIITNSPITIYNRAAKPDVPYDFWNKIIPGQTTLTYLQSLIGGPPNSITDKTAIFLAGGYRFDVVFCCDRLATEQYACGPQALGNYCPPQDTILDLVMRIDPAENIHSLDPVALTGRWDKAFAQGAYLGITQFKHFGPTGTTPGCRLPVIFTGYNLEFKCEGPLWSPDLGEVPKWYYTLYMDAYQQATLGNNIDLNLYNDFHKMEFSATFLNSPSGINFEDVDLRKYYNITQDDEIKRRLEDLVENLFVTGIGVKLRPLDLKFILFYLADSEANDPTPEEKSNINSAVNYFKARQAKLNGYQSYWVTVAGYSDGDDAERRSQAIATAVAAQLAKGGVNHMIVYGEGNKHPWVPGVPGPTPVRVEIEFEYGRGFPGPWFR